MEYIWNLNLMPLEKKRKGKENTWVWFESKRLSIWGGAISHTHREVGGVFDWDEMRRDESDLSDSWCVKNLHACGICDKAHGAQCWFGLQTHVYSSTPEVCLSLITCNLKTVTSNMLMLCFVFFCLFPFRLVPLKHSYYLASSCFGSLTRDINFVKLQSLTMMYETLYKNNTHYNYCIT